MAIFLLDPCISLGAIDLRGGSGMKRKVLEVLRETLVSFGVWGGSTATDARRSLLARINVISLEIWMVIVAHHVLVNMLSRRWALHPSGGIG